MTTIVYGQVERDNTVAANLILLYIGRICGAGNIGAVMPRVAVARSD